MKVWGAWISISLTTMVFWVFSIFLGFWSPDRIAISINENQPGSWPGEAGFFFFPSLLTVAYVVVSILLFLHNKRKIKLVYDEIDPLLSRSLLNLTFYSIAGILLLGEICLVLMNK